ncbi:MAG: helix-turn-helix transcriptional regulator [Spirochaetales bacterium]|nr:helix-turn-helix transcriptional regulator [Spirochaetales bacterium]
MKVKVDHEHDLPVSSHLLRPGLAKEKLHYHETLEVALCVQGQGTYYFSEKIFSAKVGDIFVVNNHEPHIARSERGSPCEMIILNFDPSLLLHEDDNLLKPFAYLPGKFTNCIAAESPSAEKLGLLVKSVHHELTEKQAGYKSAVRSYVILICSFLVRYYQEQRASDPWFKSSLDFRTKRHLILFMEEHYREPLELADVAQFLGVSNSAASRIFLSAVGQSFREYLNALRVQHAKRRLIENDSDITEVCFDSGFQSLPSFYRIFHQATELAPQSFRKASPLGILFEK